MLTVEAQFVSSLDENTKHSGEGQALSAIKHRYKTLMKHATRVFVHAEQNKHDMETSNTFSATYLHDFHSAGCDAIGKQWVHIHRLLISNWNRLGSHSWTQTLILRADCEGTDVQRSRKRQAL